MALPILPLVVGGGFAALFFAGSQEDKAGPSSTQATPTQASTGADQGGAQYPSHADVGANGGGAQVAGGAGSSSPTTPSTGDGSSVPPSQPVVNDFGALGVLGGVVAGVGQSVGGAIETGQESAFGGGANYTSSPSSGSLSGIGSVGAPIGSGTIGGTTGTFGAVTGSVAGISNTTKRVLAAIGGYDGLVL